MIHEMFLGKCGIGVAQQVRNQPLRPRLSGLVQAARQERRFTDLAAALVRDLKTRGLLDSTLVVWGGEFGRTPMSQRTGRDHHIKGFSFLLAGGGIKKGLAYGATDDLGYAAVENPVSVHDFHATMLYLLGIDAAKLAVKYQGLDVRLTGPEGGTVVRDILA